MLSHTFHDQKWHLHTCIWGLWLLLCRLHYYRTAANRLLPNLTWHHTKPALHCYFVGYQNIAIYYANWIQNTVRTSINHRFLSETNWGAVWRFTKEEFLGMVAPGVFNLVRAVEEGRVWWATHDLNLLPVQTDALVVHPQHCQATEEDPSLWWWGMCKCTDISRKLANPHRALRTTRQSNTRTTALIFRVFVRSEGELYEVSISM